MPATAGSHGATEGREEIFTTNHTKNTKRRKVLFVFFVPLVVNFCLLFQVRYFAINSHGDKLVVAIGDGGDVVCAKRAV